MLKSLVSKSAPSCGDVSSTTFDNALDEASPDTRVDLAIFLRPPPEVSTASNTSSAATEDKPDTDTIMEIAITRTLLFMSSDRGASFES